MRVLGIRVFGMRVFGSKWNYIGIGLDWFLIILPLFCNRLIMVVCFGGGFGWCVSLLSLVLWFVCVCVWLREALGGGGGGAGWWVGRDPALGPPNPF